MHALALSTSILGLGTLVVFGTLVLHCVGLVGILVLTVGYFGTWYWCFGGIWYCITLCCLVYWCLLLGTLVLGFRVLEFCCCITLYCLVDCFLLLGTLVLRLGTLVAFGTLVLHPVGWYISTCC